MTSAALPPFDDSWMAPGSRVTIIAQRGSGKTTLVRRLAARFDAAHTTIADDELPAVTVALLRGAAARGDTAIVTAQYPYAVGDGNGAFDFVFAFRVACLRPIAKLHRRHFYAACNLAELRYHMSTLPPFGALVMARGRRGLFRLV